MEQAKEHDLVLRVEHRPGQYVQWDGAVVSAWPASRVDEHRAGEIRATFTVGARRSMAQDAGYAIEQLVEVAVRALSPGINDPFTAMQCADRLGEALSAGRAPAFPLHVCDEKVTLASSAATTRSAACWTWRSTRSASTHTTRWTCSCACWRR